MTGFILTIDVGTTLIKGALFSDQGEILCKARLALPSTPLIGGRHHEEDPQEWHGGIRKIVAMLKKECPETPSALCISGNGPTLVYSDRDGTPLGPAFTWMDRRSTGESKEIADLTGHKIDPSFYLPKLLWLKKNKPQVYDRTKLVFGCPEYLLHFATGKAVHLLTGPALAQFVWTDDLIKQLNLPREIFPPIEMPGSPMGPLTRKAAQAWSMPEGIPVIGGGPDFVLTLLGTATVRPGHICDRSGTSDGVNLCGRGIIKDPRLMSFEHPIPGLINSSGIISNTGAALDWYKNSFMDETGYEEVFDLAGNIVAGSKGLLFLPYLTGERAPLWDPRARGAFMGLNSAHGTGEMLRAVMESTGFAIRDVMEILEESEDPVEDLRITGTPTRSHLWNQIKADITGKRILIPKIREAELTGGAILALHNLDSSLDLADIAESFVEFNQSYEPNLTNRDLYDSLYGLYKESSLKLTEISHQLADIQMKSQ